MSDAPRAVLFDFDGTLADAVGDIAVALNRALSLRGIAPFETDVVRDLVGGGAARLIMRALKAANEVPTELDLAYLKSAFVAAYQSASCDHTQLFPGVEDVLKTLKQDGYRLAVVSNKPHDLLVDVLAKLGIADAFDFVLGAGEEHALKPNSDMLIAAANALDVPLWRTVMVGDSDNDVGAAQAAKCPVVVVNFGYSKQLADSLGADACITAFEELPEVLEKLSSSATVEDI